MIGPLALLPFFWQVSTVDHKNARKPFPPSFPTADFDDFMWEGWLVFCMFTTMLYSLGQKWSWRKRQNGSQIVFINEERDWTRSTMWHHIHYQAQCLQYFREIDLKLLWLPSLDKAFDLQLQSPPRSQVIITYHSTHRIPLPSSIRLDSYERKEKRVVVAIIGRQCCRGGSR